MDLVAHASVGDPLVRVAIHDIQERGIPVNCEALCDTLQTFVSGQGHDIVETTMQCVCQSREGRHMAPHSDT